MISIDDVKPNGYGYKFPTVDFKFQNTGAATAFLWKFEIDILQANVDITPELSFSVRIEDQELKIFATNNGWGKAHKLNIELKEPTLNSIFPDLTKQIQESIDSGENRPVIKLSHKTISPGRLRTISEKFVKLHDPRDYYSYYRSNSRSELHGILLQDIKIAWKCQDEKGKEHSGEDFVKFRTYRHIAFTSNGFIEIEEPIPVGAAAGSDMTFITIINPLKGQHEVAYPISRKIPPNDIERFHIMLGASMSCSLKLRFKFYLDKEHIVKSEIFNVEIWNPRNSRWEWDYKDGTEVKRENQEDKLTWQRFNKPKAQFPFSDEEKFY